MNGAREPGFDAPGRARPARSTPEASRATPDHPLFSEALERALRRSATWHRDQRRRSSGVPYIEHPMAVALILDRLGFGEPVVIAALLHDAVEDTDATLQQIDTEFGPEVTAIVAALSEQKLDERGATRPWAIRKAEHLAAIAATPLEARAVFLADKLHNLRSILLDGREGRPVWSAFHAPRAQVLGYYREAIRRCGIGDPRLEWLAAECQGVLDRVRVLDPG